MTKHANSKAQQILKYVAKNPNAKAQEIATALGMNVQYVYTVMWSAKKKATAEKKAAIKKAVKGNWKTVSISTSEIPLFKGTIDGLSGLTVRPKIRMQSSQDAQIEMFEPTPDPVEHPAHYKVGGIETIDFIEAKKLGYNLGNVVKYLTRADYKGNKLEDLRKAQWYLTREISALK
jgi:hypothetical protein